MNRLFLASTLFLSALPILVAEVPTVLIEGGTFSFGYRGALAAEHQVTLNSFRMMTTEVTQELYEGVMGLNPSEFKGTDLPVENVNWYDAISFANALSERDGLTPAYTIAGTMVTSVPDTSGWRLPTEAEWEYAAYGGRFTKDCTYAGSNKVDEVAWIFKNSDGKTHPVGTKNPNELGLYDMAGNVWEWCWDWHGRYVSGTQVNPHGPYEGTFRVNRGGSWFDSASSARSAARDYYEPEKAARSLGFRLVAPP